MPEASLCQVPATMPDPGEWIKEPGHWMQFPMGSVEHRWQRNAINSHVYINMMKWVNSLNPKLPKLVQDGINNWSYPIAVFKLEVVVKNFADGFNW